jgi:hypothetical protein
MSKRRPAHPADYRRITAELRRRNSQFAVNWRRSVFIGALVNLSANLSASGRRPVGAAGREQRGGAFDAGPRL